MMRFVFICAVTFGLMVMDPCMGYVPPEVKQRWKETNYNKEQAIESIEAATLKGQPNDELYYAVKFIDRFANQLYSGPGEKEKLMDKAYGSWELRLAITSDRDERFYPHPEFRKFAMAFITIGDEYFGKGIAPDTNFCFVGLGGPTSRNIQRRQVFMSYEDYYINGNQVPGWDLSYYTRGFSKRWSADDKDKPPLAFTIIACTDKCLVVRGSKTGGMAIFRRIPTDMGPVAYGFPLTP